MIHRLTKLFDLCVLTHVSPSHLVNYCSQDFLNGYVHTRSHSGVSVSLPAVFQMECVSCPPLSRVAVCGGTHGNEWTGVYMVREMLQRGVERVGSASLTAVLTNPLAVDACRRYVDVDLNRCFTSSSLR